MARKKELSLGIETVTSKKEHVCDYCQGPINKGSKYTKITSRVIKVERFPSILKACDKHAPSILPLSFLWKRSGGPHV